MESLTVTLTDTDLSTLDDFIVSSKFSDRSETVRLAIQHLLYEESLWDAQRKYGSKTPCTNGERGTILAEIRQIRKNSPPRDVKIDESVSGYEHFYIRHHRSCG